MWRRGKTTGASIPTAIQPTPFDSTTIEVAFTDDTTFDAMLVTRSELGVNKEIKEGALQQALDEEELHNEMAVGNHRGLNLADFSTHVRALEEKVV